MARQRLQPHLVHAGQCAPPDQRITHGAADWGGALPADKTCASCGRRIAWRKKWERDWDSVKYCSTACRKHKVSATDERLEASILELLAGRRGGGDHLPVRGGPRPSAGPTARRARRPGAS